MTEYRECRPEEMPACIEMANLAFNHLSFVDLIPKAYGKNAASRVVHFGAFDDGKPIALVGVLRNTLFVGDTPLEYGFIGTVCVHPDARLAGHMRTLVPMSMDFMRRDGCDLAILDGNRHRYAHFGFSPAGQLMNYHFEPSAKKHAFKDYPNKNVEFVPFAREHVEAAYRLYAKQPMRALRTVDDFYDVLTSYGQVPFAIYIEGKFAGYADCFTDKLDAFSEFILEDAQEAVNVIAAWMKLRNLSNFAVHVHACDLAMHNILPRFANHSTVRPKNMVVLYDVPKVLTAFLKLKASLFPVADGELHFSIDGTSYCMEKRGSDIRTFASPAAPEQAEIAVEDVGLSFFAPTAPYSLRAPAGWLPLPFSMFCADDF